MWPHFLGKFDTALEAARAIAAQEGARTREEALARGASTEAADAAVEAEVGEAMVA